MCAAATVLSSSAGVAMTSAPAAHAATLACGDSTASVLLDVAPLYQFDGTWSTSQMWSDEIGAIGHIVLP